MPHEQDLRQRYAAMAERDYLKDSGARISMFSREMDALEPGLGPGASLLDLGCSYGLLLELAKERGIRAVGLDLSRDAVAFCREKGLDAREGGLEALREGEVFDVAFAWDVLEHVVDPGSVLRQLRSHLRRGGIVSLVVPHGESAMARVLGERWWSVVDLHLHYPSLQGLSLMMQEAGFSLCWLGTHPKEVTGALIRRWLTGKGPGGILARFIPVNLSLNVDPKDQLLVRARAE